jgi:hypothetical protein
VVNPLAAGVLLVLAMGATIAIPGASLDITIDYPAARSVFPPEFPPPEFRWRDPAFWSVEAIFADGAPSTRPTARGEPMRLGPLDPRCASSAELSVQQRNT